MWCIEKLYRGKFFPRLQIAGEMQGAMKMRTRRENFLFDDFWSCIDLKMVYYKVVSDIIVQLPNFILLCGFPFRCLEED